MIYSAVMYDSRIKYKTLAKWIACSRIGIPKSTHNKETEGGKF